MSNSRTFEILDNPLCRTSIIRQVHAAPVGYTVTVAEPTRSALQNAAQWPILECFGRQLQWPVNGKMVHMTRMEWKDVLTAAFKKEQARLAMGLDGGVVMLGARTSKFSKDEFSNWLEFLHMVAAERGVQIMERVSV